DPLQAYRTAYRRRRATESGTAGEGAQRPMSSSFFAPLITGVSRSAAGVFLLVTLALHAIADDASLERRALALERELRCLVCQNQTIAESNAPLALDLRGQ